LLPLLRAASYWYYCILHCLDAVRVFSIWCWCDDANSDVLMMSTDCYSDCRWSTLFCSCTSLSLLPPCCIYSTFCDVVCVSIPCYLLMEHWFSDHLILLTIRATVVYCSIVKPVHCCLAIPRYDRCYDEVPPVVLFTSPFKLRCLLTLPYWRLPLETRSHFCDMFCHGGLLYSSDMMTCDTIVEVLVRCLLTVHYCWHSDGDCNCLLMTLLTCWCRNIDTMTGERYRTCMPFLFYRIDVMPSILIGDACLGQVMW